MADKEWKDFPIKELKIEQKNYPSCLRELKDPPKTLYYRGEISKELLSNCIAIVGSRAMTRYGKSVAEDFSTSLALSDITIISGFMYGIDAVAHQACVRERGRTIAVLGSGIDRIYPPDHEQLYTCILRENGVVLSEFKPEQKPKPWMYAKRNRIIAALANLGIIVIEASVKSGSLITADYANKLRRTVYAVPGPIKSSASEGTNLLIKLGKAKLITSIEDIKGINNLKLKSSSSYASGDNNSSPSHSPVEDKILEVLKSEATPLAVDEIVMLTGLSSTEVSTKLTIMSLQGLVDEFNGKYEAKQEMTVKYTTKNNA